MEAGRATAWWNSLPEDYHRVVCEPAVADGLRWQVWSAAAIDVTLRTAVASLVGAAMVPAALARGGLSAQLDSLAFYRDSLDLATDPCVLFPEPEQVRVRVQRASCLAWGTSGIRRRVIHFDSPWVAMNPAIRDRFGRHEANHQTVAQHWYHPDGPRPTLVFLHGFLADPWWLNALMFSLRKFWSSGFDILLVTLPFHGARREVSDPFSGFGLFAHGLAHFNESILQAACDVRVLLRWLRDEGAPATGISGLSLGGYVSAFVAALDPRLSFCIPNVPVVSPADMLLEWVPLSWVGERWLRRSGRDLAEVRHGLAIHSPLTWSSRVPADGLLVIGGAGDRFVSPRYVDLLHRHWRGSTLHWFPGNHVIHLNQSEYLDLMQGFMDAAVRRGRQP